MERDVGETDPFTNSGLSQFVIVLMIHANTKFLSTTELPRLSSILLVIRVRSRGAGVSGDTCAIAGAEGTWEEARRERATSPMGIVDAWEDVAAFGDHDLECDVARGKRLLHSRCESGTSAHWPSWPSCAGVSTSFVRWLTTAYPSLGVVRFLTESQLVESG